MSRITLDSKCRLCRAAGTKLFLKGTRCFSSKCPLEKKGAIPPGMHGAKRAKKPTDYGIQLQAKQKAKRIYGIQETQFHNYFTKAKTLKGQVGTNLINLLEKRLDNIVYRAGLSLSRTHAKQIISHGHVLINDRVLNVASYPVKAKDVITFDKTVLDQVDTLRFADPDFRAPEWLDVNKTKHSISLTREPGLSDLGQEVDVNLIVEYYSR